MRTIPFLRSFLFILLIVIVSPIGGFTIESKRIKKSEEFDLSNYKGRLVILQIGHIGCSNTEQGLVRLEELNKNNLMEDVVLIYVNAGQPDSSLLTFLETHQLTYELFDDPQKKIAATFDYKVIPTFYLIGKWGEVRYEGPWDEKMMSSNLQILREEQDPDNKTFFLDTSVTQGQMAPEFTLNDTEGNSIVLTSLLKKSRLLLLLFGNTNCPFSRKAHAQLNELHKKFAKKGFNILTVNIGTYEEKTKQYYDNLNLPSPVALDTDEKVADRYGIKAVPTVLLLEADTKVYLRTLFDPQIEQAINEYLTKGKGAGKTPVKMTKSKAVG